MEFLCSNTPPLRFSKRNTDSCFDDLMRSAEGFKIASGYVSADALAELKKIVEENKKSHLELVIGMHHFEGFSPSQYQAAVYLDDYLRTKNIGIVKVATVFKFHGKVYSFLKQSNPFAGILGSSNLNSVFDSQNNYETDLYVNEAPLVKEFFNFITQLSEKACTPLRGYTPRIVEDENKLLEGHDGVDKINKSDLINVYATKRALLFKIPIKASEDTQKSNLNAFFGKGRESKNGLIKPRHWYETEIIVPKQITSQAGYPKKESVITVFTDDGWKFKCKISGDYGKNFRSEGDLKILGRWIKGRLENKGSLKVGEPVTEDTMKHYGRNDFELISTANPEVWILNFKAKS